VTVAARTAHRVWIGTSWKMTKTLAQSRDFIDRVSAASIPHGVQPFVLPSHTALATVRERLPADSPILLGAQNAHWAAEGPWTGEISMRMAADAGARLIEIGHSERREHFGETDATVAAKAAAAVAHGLMPLICVGEPLRVRADGEAVTYVAEQVRAALAPIMRAINATVAEIADRPLRAVLHGGSVRLDGATQLLRDGDTDGLFVGRAAWDPDGFTALLDQPAARSMTDSAHLEPSTLKPCRRVLQELVPAGSATCPSCLWRMP